MSRVKVVLFIICFSSIPTLVNCQIIGDNILTVRELEEAPPCERNESVLLYCHTVAAKTSYMFNREGYVHSINKFTSYNTFDQAQYALDARLSEFDAEPYVTNGYYHFFYSDDHQLVFTIQHNQESRVFVLSETEGNTALMD
jgi:hypothetical protein